MLLATATALPVTNGGKKFLVSDSESSLSPLVLTGNPRSFDTCAVLCSAGAGANDNIDV